VIGVQNFIGRASKSGRGIDMESKEFNQGAKRTETASSVIFDVRGFGERQGEAIDPNGRRPGID